MSITRCIPATALALLAGCHGPPPPPVPLTADAAAMSRLAGTWEGSYQSPETGRSGSIVFTLVAGEDHAHGDVMMVPTGSNEPMRPAPRGAGDVPAAAAPAQVLTIDFVRATGDSVSGTLDPYHDPQCDCAARSSFAGRLEGNTIRGTFVTRRGSWGTVNGTWAVRLKR